MHSLPGYTVAGVRWVLVCGRMRFVSPRGFPRRIFARFSIPASSRSSYFALPHCRGSTRAGHSRTFEQFVPVLFAYQATGQQVVPISLNELSTALGTYEALEVKDVMTLGLRARCRPACSHDELVRWNRLSAGRTCSGVPE